jgi:hypothetical protein
MKKKRRLQLVSNYTLCRSKPIGIRVLLSNKILNAP